MKCKKHYNLSMKKAFCMLLCIFFSAAVYSQVLNNSQIIESGHWIYKTFENLSAETTIGNFTSNTPVTVGQLRMHFKEYDREALSEAGKSEYDKAKSFLFTQKNLFPGKLFQAEVGIDFAPEFCYKSNEEIDWAWNYYYNDNPVNMDLGVGISDYYCMGGRFFLGKNWYYSSQPDNLTNIPLGFDQYEFMFPRFAYSSFGYAGEGWGLNFNTGKEGLTIGNTRTGSILYNKTFETDGYVQLTAYTDDVKYTMNVAEVSPEKFLYWHQIDVRLFKKIKLGAMEGALVNRPFELRFLNPMVVYHSYAFWKNFTNDIEDHYYNEGYCCSYLGLTFEINPVKYLRLYGLYAMNEIQLPNEHHDEWLSYPDSLGGQLGAELTIPSDFGGFWQGGLEAVYCSPFLYVKQSPDWSLYRARKDNVTWDTVNSWIGSPFGPDTLAFDFDFSYEQPEKWSAGLEYLLCFKGENGFKLFDEANYKTESWKKQSEKIWTYYPYTKYVIADDIDSSSGRDQAVEEGRNMWMSGVCQTTHQLALEGSWTFTPKLSLKGQFIYSFVINARHISENFQQGMQCALSCQYKLF